jgi:Rrf2 family cysteine metabolism transcriptional repressor
MISQKCQYALRSVFELAKRSGSSPTPTSVLAGAQAIPARFLESSLADLRRGGLVNSRRGARGGYVLACDPKTLPVGRVIRLIEGPLSPVDCDQAEGGCALSGGCAFMELWDRAQRAVEEVYDQTTFQDLIDREQDIADHKPALDYCI